MTACRTSSSRAAGAALAALALAGCGGGESVEGPPPQAPATIRLTSDAFADGETIPERYTCEGEDVAPALRWDGVPAGAQALALVMEDPDAPSGTFVHWTVLDIPPDAETLPADAPEGENSFGDEGYGGPCPPEDDEPHRYVFLLYALEAPLGLDAGAPPQDVRDAIEREAIASGQLTGRFGR
jgi:Raf kinase inhibitor-like YbhB/YbcL family protein